MSLVSVDRKLLIKTINDQLHLVTGGDSCCCTTEQCSIIDIRYVWECNPSADLDTSTTFLGNTVGWPARLPENGGCGLNNQYIIWDGDNTGTSGAEHITVNVRKAIEDGLWNNSVSIELKAGWYAPAGGSGKADVLVKLIKADGTVCKEICCQTGDLPSQSNCASNSVGNISVTENNGVLDFSISPCTACSSDCSTTTTPEPTTTTTTTTTTSTTPDPSCRTCFYYSVYDNCQCTELGNQKYLKTITVPANFTLPVKVTADGSVDDVFVLDGDGNVFGQNPNLFGTGAHGFNYEWIQNNPTFTIEALDTYGGCTGITYTVCIMPLNTNPATECEPQISLPPDDPCPDTTTPEPPTTTTTIPPSCGPNVYTPCGRSGDSPCPQGCVCCGSIDSCTGDQLGECRPDIGSTTCMYTGCGHYGPNDTCADGSPATNFCQDGYYCCSGACFDHPCDPHGCDDYCDGGFGCGGDGCECGEDGRCTFTQPPCEGPCDESDGYYPCGSFWCDCVDGFCQIKP